jgi:energy-coupling factor transporter transmembrane protein EcfT
MHRWEIFTYIFTYIWTIILIVNFTLLSFFWCFVLKFDNKKSRFNFYFCAFFLWLFFVSIFFAWKIFVLCFFVWSQHWLLWKDCVWGCGHEFCGWLLSPIDACFHFTHRCMLLESAKHTIMSCLSSTWKHTHHYTFIGFNTYWLYKLKHIIYILTLKQVKYYDANCNHQQSTFLPIWLNFAGELMKDCAPKVNSLQQDLDMVPKIELLTNLFPSAITAIYRLAYLRGDDQRQETKWGIPYSLAQLLQSNAAANF